MTAGRGGTQASGAATAGALASRWLVGAGLACVAALGIALVSQHRFDMQPCPWCVLQRALFALIAIVCAAGLVWRSIAGRRVAAGLGLLLALAGAAAALWQHFQAAASASCDLTLADRIVSRWLQLDRAWPDVFEARATCAEAASTLLGVAYDFWSLALFGLLAAAFVRALSLTPDARLKG